jgi:hypothetical protein
MERFEKLAAVAAYPRPAPVLRKELLAHKEEVEAYQLLWKNNPQVREMVARALTCNHQNAPQTFPARLEPYRHPPRPVLRGQPANP